MKKKYFVIALMAFLCAAFIYMGIGRQSYNYKIVGLSLQRVNCTRANIQLSKCTLFIEF